MSKLSGKRNRREQIGVVLDRDEYEKISADAKAAGLTKSAYCRMVLIAEHNRNKEREKA